MNFLSLDITLLAFFAELFHVIFNEVNAQNSSFQTHRPSISNSGSFCHGPQLIYVPALQSCCRVCPPGSGVTQPCTPTINSRCVPCTPGRYSVIYDHEEGCHKCPVCQVNSHQVHACSAVKPTECECDAGYYHNSENGICDKCTSCQPGFGASLACTSHQDTVCEWCPNGTFSDIYSLDFPCQPCSNCTGNQEIAKHCTPESDCVCKEELEDACTFWRFYCLGGASFVTVLYIVLLTVKYVAYNMHTSKLEKQLSACHKVKDDNQPGELTSLLAGMDFRRPI